MTDRFRRDRDRDLDAAFERFTDPPTAAAAMHLTALAARATAQEVNRAVRLPSTMAMCGLRRALRHHCRRTGAVPGDLALALLAAAAMLAAMLRIPRELFTTRAGELHDIGCTAEARSKLAAAESQ